MSNLSKVQTLLAETNAAALLIPTSDEYLSEYSHPNDQRLAWVSGFVGSTGSVIIMRDSAAIFVDGRYTEQAARQVDTDCFDICGYGNPARIAWLQTKLSPGDTLMVDSRLHSEAELRQLIAGMEGAGYSVSAEPENLIDAAWIEGRPPASRSSVFDYDVRYSGLPREEKIASMRERLVRQGCDLFVVADPEDVAWLLNIRSSDSQDTLDRRDFSKPVASFRVPAPLSRLLLPVEGTPLWFIERARLLPDLIEDIEGIIDIREPIAFNEALARLAAGKVVAANARRTSYRHAQIITRNGTMVNDPAVVQARGVKHPNEIAAAREGYRIDGAAVVRFLAWLVKATKHGNVTELEAAQRQTELRAENALYLGPSMSNLSASGPNAALPHYVPSADTNRIINEHPIYWMDSGGQYLGCSTDNTVCFAIGTPEPRHILAHTLAVKGWMALARARFPEGIQSTQLDSFARQFLWQHGMDYGHGTGHGVGNFMNIHEVPHIRREIDHPAVGPLVAGQIISNEPGYYAQGDFGVRIESHILTVPSPHKGFLEFETLSMLPIDPRLIDPALLDTEEAFWLADYHSRISAAYEDILDAETVAWLDEIVDTFAAIAHAKTI
jgi:Xaa-Pro aminopeptidase